MFSSTSSESFSEVFLDCCKTKLDNCDKKFLVCSCSLKYSHSSDVSDQDMVDNTLNLPVEDIIDISSSSNISVEDIFAVDDTDLHSQIEDVCPTQKKNLEAKKEIGDADEG